MEQIVLVVHVLVALAIIGLILLQQGKGADVGASFGSGGSQTIFGSAGGGNVLTRATAILATVFFITSFGMAIFAKNKAESLGDVGIPTPAAEQQVVVPQPEGGVPVPNAAAPAASVPATAAPPPPVPAPEQGGQNNVPVPGSAPQSKAGDPAPVPGSASGQ